MLQASSISVSDDLPSAFVQHVYKAKCIGCLFLLVILELLFHFNVSIVMYGVPLLQNPLMATDIMSILLTNVLFLCGYIPFLINQMFLEFS